MTIFLCEDTLDGILTAVYEAWDSRLGHANVRLQIQEETTLELFCSYREISTDLTKAEKVLKTIRRRMGDEAAEHICRAAACADPRKADAIYRMIVLGLALKQGSQICSCLQDVHVDLVLKLSLKAWHEAHRLMGFLRFRELKNGVLYSEIAPAHPVLPLIAPHFADRFQQESWIIHDAGRGQLAIHRRNGWWMLMEAQDLNPAYFQELSPKEEDFEALWKAFCEHVSIPQRKNPGCQQNLLPLRFRPYMTEFSSP